MKKNYMLALSFAVILFTALNLISNESATHPATPDWGFTSAPTENNCGNSSCHNTAANQFGGTLSVTFSSQFYVPGNSYVVTVSTDEAGMSRFGFATCCLDASNIKAGTASLINTSNTSSNTVVNNRWYVGHKAAGTTKVWTFNWNAPVVSAGDVTFYAASICANNNGNATGDHCYTNSAVFPVLTSVNSILDTENNFQLVQNPVSTKIVVSYFNASPGNSIIRLLDLNGRVIKELLNETQNAGAHTSTFLNIETSGLYLIDYSNGNNHSIKKMIVI